jgi:glucose/arabinose dehydrogenase
MLLRRLAPVLAIPLAVVATALLPGQARAALGTPHTVASGLNVPWGLAFLPNGDALVSARATGRIKRIPRKGGRARTVMRIPGVARDFGEGGLLGIAVSPNYRRDKLVYAYYTSSHDNRVVRFRLGGRIRTVLTGIHRAGNHNGGRIAFGPDGNLYIGTGDAGDRASSQDRRSLNGKILRVTPSGKVPRGNPFSGSPVYSMGHRNVQGLAWDRSGRLWATEFGQDQFDEINLIRKGGNYGWPVVEGNGDTQGGRFRNPLVTWTPAEASPSGAAIVGSTLNVGALRGQRLWQVPLRGTRTGTPRAAFEGRYGRIRTIVRAPGGRSLWITTSNRDGYGAPRSGDDRILRVSIR